MIKKILTLSAISCLTLTNCFAIQACRDCEDDRGHHLISGKCPCEKNKPGTEGAVASNESNSDKEALLCSSSSSSEVSSRNSATSGDSISSSSSEDFFATSSSDDQSSSDSSLV